MTQETHKMQLTGPEVVLYKAAYYFAVSHEKLSSAAAAQKAEQKIIQKRAMASKIASRH
jgi:hypothetical protein